MNLEKFYFKLQNDLKYLHLMADITDELLQTYGYPESIKDDLSLSVTELCENAIIHGNKNDKSKFINVEFFLEGNKVTIEVEDEGGSFNKKKINDPTKEDLLKTSGRGIFIVEHLVDEFSYSFSDNNNTKIQIIKNVKS